MRHYAGNGLKIATCFRAPGRRSRIFNRDEYGSPCYQDQVSYLGCVI